jgi:NitT/TauT family transport system permease protein
LSGPWQTAKAVRSAARDGYLWSDLGITSSRLVIAFALGFAASFGLGFALGLSDRLARVFDVWITVLGSVPALVYIVACYLVIGISNTAAVIAVAIVVMPNATSAISDGVRATDPGLREMGRTFGAGRQHLLWHVIVPQAAPWIFTAARSCWSLTWRIMVFVELLGRPNGVGYRIQYWFNLADMPRVTAAALPLVVLIVLVDVGLFRTWERRLARWRPVELR